jgi:hypothetical protein
MKNVNLEIHLKTMDYLPHLQLYPSTTLAQLHITVFVFFGSYTVFTFFYSNFQLFFGLSTTEETSVVEIRIWCIKIGIVLVLKYYNFPYLTRI